MNKQKTSGAIISFLSQIIMLIVGLTYTPIMIRILGQSEYGLFQLVQSIVNYLSLLNFGFSGAYIRYYSIADSEKDNNKISQINGLFLRIFLVISFLCVLIGTILYININVLGTKISESDYQTARVLLIILVINMAISFPCSLFTIYMCAQEQFAVQKLIELILNIFIPILNLPLLFWGFKSVGVVSVTLLLSIIRLFISSWYCFKILGMKINIRYFDKHIFSELFLYTFFIFLSDVIDQLNSNVDKFLLGRIKGTISVAVYSVGFQIRGYYTYLSWSFPEVFIPEVNRIVAGGKDENILLSKLFILTGRVNNYICLLVLTGFAIIGKEFVRLWVGNEYINSYYVCLILMIASYFSSVQTLGINIQNAKNLHKVRSIVYLFISLLNILCSIFLIIRYGEIGTSLGTLFAVILGSGLFMNYYYYKYLKLDIVAFWKEMLKWIGFALLICFIGWLIFKGIIIDTWPKLLLFASAYTFYYVLILWFLGIGINERKHIKNIIRKKLKIFGKKNS